MDYAKQCQLQFGVYSQVHKANDKKNQARVTGYIVLYNKVNAQGGYYSVSLSTGKQLNHQHITPRTQQSSLSGVTQPK